MSEPQGKTTGTRVPEENVIHLGDGSGIERYGNITPISPEVHTGEEHFSGAETKKKSGCLFPFLLMFIIFSLILGVFYVGLRLDRRNSKIADFCERAENMIISLFPSSKRDEAEEIYVQPMENDPVSEPAGSGYAKNLPSGVRGNLSGGSVFSGWDYEKNTGKPNSSVKEGARDKFTQLRGDGSDTVTVMVYMSGADIETKHGVASADIKEMLAAQTGQNVNVVILTGGTLKWRTKGISKDKNQLFQIADNELKLIEDNMWNGSMTETAVLSTFIQYCAWKFPADRYELIFWGHGGTPLTGFCYDEKHADGNTMSLAELDSALNSVRNIHFDFIGFDAPYTASYETAFVLSKYADYLIASEGGVSSSGWYYTDWLTKLGASPSADTLSIGQKIIDDSIAHCSLPASLALIDLSEFSAGISEKLGDFAADIERQINSGSYAAIAEAITNAKKFDRADESDQIDLVQFARNVDSIAGRKLAYAILSAVKYNLTSADNVNSYGMSVYFPWQTLDRVDEMTRLYAEIGMNEKYSQCVRDFAAILRSAQLSSPADTYTAYTSLLNEFSESNVYGSTPFASSGSIKQQLSEQLAGTDTVLDLDAVSKYMGDNRFYPTQMVWNKNGDSYEMVMTDENWSCVNCLERNILFDNGSGYVDLGLDTAFEFTDSGMLKGRYDGKWLALNGQLVAFYHMETVEDGDKYTVTGRIPVIFNSAKADLIAVFDNEHPDGYIAGVRYAYDSEKTQAVPKALEGIRDNARIEPVCGHYGYGGDYTEDYKLGEKILAKSGLTLSRVPVSPYGKVIAMYKFTDFYAQSYWSPKIP